MFTLIENGDVYAPEPLGRQTVLLVDSRIGKVGGVDRRAVEAVGCPVKVIDATGCVVTPGLVDPHEHLLGGSGEDGLGTQTPMIFLQEIAPYGITTVVGVLGVDTTMKTMAGLLAHVKGLEEDGITARMWSGGYNVPPTTVMRSIREDIMFIDEIVGAGEVAIADHRGLCPTAAQLAPLVLDTHVGGLLTGKAGVTHFHVGEHEQRLRRLWELLDGDYAISAEMLYPTHVERSERLLDEAIALAKRGSYVDMDVVNRDLCRWLPYYLEHGGPPERLTLSSDAGASSPRFLHEQLCQAVVRGLVPLELALRCVTENPSRVLKLPGKGRLDPMKDGDVLVMRRDSLDVVHVIARGRVLVRDGALEVKERFIPTTSRQVEFHGEKAQ